MTGPSRAPRGSYSKLKCIQCRTRKIKCVLPNLAIEPSDSPQPKETSCIRCQQQGLECVVDKTILGRPSHKRRRSQSGTTSLTEPDDSGDGHAHDVEHNEEDDDLQAFVLSHVQSAVDDIDRPMFPPKMAKPSRHEVFAALVDSTHLLSALLARDALFAVKTGLRMPDAPMEPVQLLSDELIFSMDKQYDFTSSVILKSQLTFADLSGIVCISLICLHSLSYKRHLSPMRDTPGLRNC